MVSKNLSKTRNLRTDIVVIGGGGAGLAAAVTAAENGSRVILLEKGALGGNSAMAWGLFAAESPVQKRAMIDCSRDDCFKIAMDFSHWRINPLIIRAFIDKSGDTIQWLEEKGLQFDLVPFYPNQAPPTWHIPEGRGAELIKVLAQSCRDLGVELMTHTPAIEILKGAKGEIRGVLAKNKTSDLKIRTGRVIIATGGYAGNRKMLKKFCSAYPGNMERIGLPHKGDGFTMANRFGAASEGLGIIMMAGPTPPHMAHLKIGENADSFIVRLMAFALEPNTLWVNKTGKRFTDEAIGFHHYVSPNAVARQPDSASFTIFDSRLLQMMEESGLILGMGTPNGSQGNKLPGLKREFKALAKKGPVKISNSWKGIADWIGAVPKDLKTTIDEYNLACDRGHDSVYVKDPKYLISLRSPPYYAIKCHTTILNTIGGIKVNERMEVLDMEDKTIDGLFAAGVDVGGWQTETYSCVLSGGAFGFAINSGRIAAESAIR